MVISQTLPKKECVCRRNGTPTLSVIGFVKSGLNPPGLSFRDPCHSLNHVSYVCFVVCHVSCTLWKRSVEPKWGVLLLCSLSRHSEPLLWHLLWPQISWATGLCLLLWWYAVWQSGLWSSQDCAHSIQILWSTQRCIPRELSTNSFICSLLPSNDGY